MYSNDHQSAEENSKGVTVQRSLAIGAANDPLEHEAESMADRVMRMPESSLIQRKCAHCEEEEKVQRKPLVSFIQKMGNSSGTTASEKVSTGIQSTKGSGSSIPETTRTFMETRFGSDFSNVKIHTGDYAVQMSRELNAQAFTVGNDIYFNSGKYSPNSESGKHLLAHELTHTIQQSTGIFPKRIQRIITDEMLESRAEMASRPRVWNCASFTSSLACNLSPCRAASGRLGRCFWGMPEVEGGPRCRCRDTSTDEPAPARFEIPSWLKYVLGAAAMAAIVACFATGVCEFGAVVAGLGAATAAAVIAILNAAGIRDSGSTI